jgi:hypothetical protein
LRRQCEKLGILLVHLPQFLTDKPRILCILLCYLAI